MQKIGYLNAFAACLFVAASAPVFAGWSCGTGYTYILVGKGEEGCTAPLVAGQGSKRDKKMYAGINWKFDGKGGPELVVGYQNVKVKSNKNVAGGRAELSLPLKDGIKPGALKLSGVAGNTSAQGLLGAGYQFGQGFLLTGGAQLPFLTGGLDYLPGQGVQPYLGVNSLKKLKTPTGAGGCPSFDPTALLSDFASLDTSGGDCFYEYVPVLN